MHQHTKWLRSNSFAPLLVAHISNRTCTILPSFPTWELQFKTVYLLFLLQLKHFMTQLFLWHTSWLSWFTFYTNRHTLLLIYQQQLSASFMSVHQNRSSFDEMYHKNGTIPHECFRFLELFHVTFGRCFIKERNQQPLWLLKLYSVYVAQRLPLPLLSVSVNLPPCGSRLYKKDSGVCDNQK